MLKNTEPQQSSFLPETRRARFQQLTLFEVSDSELTVLEKGSPDSINLNFAIFLLSVATTLLVALVTTAIDSDRVLITFIVGTALGYVVGFFLLISWLRNRSSVSKCIQEIRKRLPPEGTAEPLEIGEENPPGDAGFKTELPGPL